MDRTSKGKSELVLLQGRARPAHPFQEEIVGIQDIIAEELENRTVIGVRSRLGDDANIGTAIASVSGIVQSCLYFKLLKGIGIGHRNTATPLPAALHIAHTYAVQFPIVVIGPCPVYKNSVVGARDLGERDSPATKFPCVKHSSGHARRKPGYLGKVSRHQWQSNQCSPSNNSPKSRNISLNHRYLRLLEDCCKLKVDLRTLCFCYGDSDSSGGGSEARFASVKFVAPGWQEQERESASLI